MMSSGSQTTDDAVKQRRDAEIQALRALLLADDRRALLAVADRLRALEASGKDPEALLDGLRALQSAKPSETARVLAPTVVGAVRSEIVNSRDSMVAALYPITGRLVTAAVSDAFRKLVSQINDRVEAATSGHAWRLRMRAMLTGRSIGEVALAQMGDDGARRVLWIERGSGALLGRWSARPNEDERDDDIVSALITAVSALAEDAFAAGDSSLRSVDLNGRSVVLHASPDHILAIETASSASQARQADLQAACVDFLEQWREPPPSPDQALAQFAALLNRPADAAPKSKRGGLLVIALLLAALLGWLGWRAYSSWRLDRAVAAAETALRADPAIAAWPLRAERRNGGVEIWGVAPESTNLGDLGARLELAAGRELAAFQVQTPGAADAVAGLARRVTALGAESARTGDLQARDARIQSLEATLLRLGDRLSALEAAAASPETRLAQWAATARIVFSEDAEPLDPARAETTLGEGAALLAQTPRLRLRVIGHSDGLGDPAARRQAAQSRADWAAAQLVALGAPAEQVTIINALDSDRADSVDGPGSANRRVDFALSAR